MNLSIPISSSTLVLTPRYWMAIPSMHLVTTIESSLEAQSQGVIRNESFLLYLASPFGQTPVIVIEYMADTQVRKKEEEPHNLIVTNIVKAQSVWSKAFNSQDLIQEHEMLNCINFQANTLKSISKARSIVEKILNDEKKKAWKIELIGMKLLCWMDKFKEIGDTMVQFDPIYTALLWAVVQFLLKVHYTARSLDWAC
jgi:hypothetical protein